MPIKLKNILFTLTLVSLCVFTYRNISMADATTKNVAYTQMQCVHTVGNVEKSTATFTCKKDATVTVLLLGNQYQSSGDVKYNDTIIYSYGSSLYEPKYMQILDIKAGDTISFNIGSGKTAPGYRMFGFVFHEEGVF